MSNDITITESFEDFKKKDPTEQSYTIYKVISAMQTNCNNMTTDFNKRINAVETKRKMDTALAVGSGGGAGVLLSWIKMTFFGE